MANSGASADAKSSPAYLNNVQPVRIDQGTLTTSTTQIKGGSNRLLTSITLCTDAAATNCQTIDDIIVDTGSVGLKIYNYALSDGGASFPDERDADNNRLAMCAHYESGYAWGPLKIATLRIAGETARDLPIAVINGAATAADQATADQNLLPVPDACSTRKGKNLSRKYADSNGILGVGPSFSDCADCATTSTYYACTNANECKKAYVPIRMQTTQPIASFSADNNGFIIRLPGVDGFSTSPVAGQMIFGIGTQPDNQPSGVTAFTLDQHGKALLTLDGVTLPVLVDSGTRYYKFASDLPTGTKRPFYEPPVPVTENATFSAIDQTGLGPQTQRQVSFTVADSTSARQAHAAAIDGLAMRSADDATHAIFGLPFFFGKTLYFGLTGRNSPFGTGPLIAF